MFDFLIEGFGVALSPLNLGLAFLGALLGTLMRTDGFAFLSFLSEFDGNLEHVADDAGVCAGVDEQVVDARAHRFTDADANGRVDVAAERRHDAGDGVTFFEQAAVHRTLD